MTSGPAPGTRRTRFRRPMTARAADEEHRAATPLELLFDLTFVVAVSRAAAELADDVGAGNVGHAVVAYAMVFFGIWWAWMNFTWFASAYDTDDVGYRLLTLLQMAGVLVYAAGVHDAFEDADFVTGTIGYVLMRVALVLQWARAARSDPEHRATARRYVIGVSLVQAAWVLRLLLPEGLAFAMFFVLALVDVLVPLWAERPRQTTWHPGHIAERYGLFTIIVLGECVLAVTVALQAVVEDDGWDTDLVLLGVGGLVLLFALWWMYFLKDAGEGLRRRPEHSFVWGYGHYVVFAALAALGAGLEVEVEALGHHIEASELVAALAVTVPVALFVVVVWLLHAPLAEGYRESAVEVLVAAVAVLAVALLVPAGLSLALVPWLTALPVALLVATHLDGTRADPHAG
jgi:low temperature requirement protein LtrA